MRKLFTLLLFSLILVNQNTFAQVSLTTIGSAYTQNFDGLANTGSPTWADNTTVTGWYSNRTTYIVSTGTSTTGGLYSFGSSSATDRSLGALSSSSASPTFAVRLVNNTGGDITAFDISLKGEQWRQTANAQSLTFDYQVGATNISSGTWTSVSALNFTALKTGTAGALDGNAAGNFTNISSTIVVTVANGQEIWLRWSKTGSTSPGLSIDDFSVTPQTPTITQYYSQSTGDLNSATTWGTNIDGSGTNPLNFTDNFQVFNIVNNSTPSISSDWTVSGGGSKIILGNGIDPISFTISSSSAIIGTIDVSANSTLTIQNATIPTFGTIDNASTIDFAQSGTVIVNAGNYGNLKLTNGTKTFAANTTNIAGNLIIDGVANLNGAGSPFTTINLAGNLTFQNSSSFSADNTARLTLNCTGSSAQTITGNGTEVDVFRISVANTAGVSLSTSGGSTNVVAGNSSGGGITTTNGNLTTNSNTITLFTSAGSALLTEAAGHYVIGTVTSTKTAVGIGTSTVGGLGATIAAGADDIGDVTVTRVTGTNGIVTVGSNSGISRKFTISSTNPPASGRDITFTWISDDDNGKTLTSGTTWKSIDNGSSWSQIASGDYSGRSVSVTGETALGIYTFSDASSPLPAELTSFTASTNENSVTLNWQTATEVNNYGFEILRSTQNDNANWLKVGFVKGAGNSNSPKSYTFTDQPSGGTSFSYRLKQLDNDGKCKYYDAITVSLSALSEAKLMQNSPNPFNPSTAIKFYIPTDSDVRIQIFDILGREVRTLLNGQNQAGYHIIYWNGRDNFGQQAASGVYLYRLTAGNYVETKKMNLLK